LVSLFDFEEQKHFQFILPIAGKKVMHVQSYNMQKNDQFNFLLFAALDVKNNSFYSLYRNGDMISMNVSDDHHGHSCLAKLQHLSINYVGQASFISDSVLVIRGQNVKFFKRKQVKSESTEAKFEWVHYHTIDIMGCLCYTDGDRFRIVTYLKIYMYQLEPETLVPQLQSVIFNFMSSMFMIESKSLETYISYTTG
jgi:hypothetical protein